MAIETLLLFHSELCGRASSNSEISPTWSPEAKGQVLLPEMPFKLTASLPSQQQIKTSPAYTSAQPSNLGSWMQYMQQHSLATWIVGYRLLSMAEMLCVCPNTGQMILHTSHPHYSSTADAHSSSKRRLHSQDRSKVS